MVSPTTLAERLLDALHQTNSHDLPNQVLSLQSLINLLDMDEAARLDAAGREYLRRLRAVADKIEGQVRFLKAISGLARYAPKMSAIDLPDLFRELQAEARSVVETPLTWSARFAVHTVRGDHDLLYPSLGDLLKAMVEGGTPRTAKTVHVASSVAAERTVVEMSVSGLGLEKRAAIVGQRCEVQLARERLRLLGIDLHVGAARTDGLSVTLTFSPSDA